MPSDASINQKKGGPTASALQRPNGQKEVGPLAGVHRWADGFRFWRATYFNQKVGRRRRPPGVGPPEAQWKKIRWPTAGCPPLGQRNSGGPLFLIRRRRPSSGPMDKNDVGPLNWRVSTGGPTSATLAGRRRAAGCMLSVLINSHVHNFFSLQPNKNLKTQKI